MGKGRSRNFGNAGRLWGAERLNWEPNWDPKLVQTGLILTPRSPMVTGTSVLGLKFSGGVLLAADMVGSYGSLARFRGISRLLKVNNSTVLGASGDVADFQHLRQLLEQMVIDEELLGDGHSYSPRAVHSWLTRVLYNRRSKINPLWNTLVIGGDLLERCLKVLYYRDAQSFNRYEIATVTEQGVEVEGPLTLEANWDIAHVVSGFE
ncbi:proteasome subunit beta type-4-like [Malurus melanocephalus]|uniref:proteasome subunit beta type-4-like n=1 Tax=Malurus melanocephalus TaxID=175006 RepID=UPI00254879EC|nr:proteasome subunit beta type-4-like [Malurus melanocephalus]